MIRFWIQRGGEGGGEGEGASERMSERRFHYKSFIAFGRNKCSHLVTLAPA